MKKCSEGNPRKGDIPQLELVRQAEEMIQAGWTVYFKFTCPYCGERCTFTENPNTMFNQGECFACGQESIFDVGGFTLAKETTGADLPDVLKEIQERRPHEE